MKIFLLICWMKGLNKMETKIVWCIFMYYNHAAQLLKVCVTEESANIHFEYFKKVYEDIFIFMEKWEAD